MKKIDSHLHVAEIIAGYCRRGELRAAGNGMAEWGSGETFRLLPEGYGEIGRASCRERVCLQV